jgi:hypothetical protein
MGESTRSISDKNAYSLDRGGEGEASVIKYDMSRDRDVVGGGIKATIPFVIRGIVDENTLCGTGSKFM